MGTLLYLRINLTGHQQTGWETYEVLKAMYNLFKDTPARRSLYMDITGDTVFPVKFTSIRWLENGPCVERALKIFDKVSQFVTDDSVPENHNQKILKAAMAKPLLKARLAAVKSVIADCEPFLRRFQSDKPLAPFLYTALLELFHNLMARIVKTKKLEAVSSQNIYLDLTNNENLLATENIGIGFEAKRLLKDAKCSEKDKLLFKTDFRKFIVALIGKLLEKSPIKSRFVRGLSCFDPKVVRNFSDIAIKRVDIVLETLHESDKIKGEVADNAKKQYQKMVSEAQSTWSQKFEGFNDDGIGLDEFYHLLIGADKQYEEIWYVMKICLIISHGNASVE